MQRLKTVYRNAGEVMHVWAQQSGHDVRCCNAHTDGTALYSYVTPVANFVENAKGVKAVLITTVNYSSTTNKNMPTASDIPGNIAVFHVEHIGRTGGRAPYPSSRGYHADNIEIMRGEYMSLLKKLSRAKANAESYTHQLTALRNKAKTYGKFFNVPMPKFAKEFPEVTPEAIARAKAVTMAETKRKTEANAARREADRANAETMAQQYLDGNRDYCNAYMIANASAETKAKVAAFDVEKWRKGELSRLDYNHRSDVGTMLRVKGEDVETSRGATFPLAHGLKALPLIRAVVARGEVWQRNGKTIHLGAYQIDRIEAGQIVAGCHTIPIAEVERLAAALGV